MIKSSAAIFLFALHKVPYVQNLKADGAKAKPGEISGSIQPVYDVAKLPCHAE